MGRTEGPVRDVYYPVYRTWMNFFVRYVILTISLIILNTLVIKEFRRYVKIASTITEKPKEQEKRLTHMMIVVVVIFVTCNLVDNIYHILRGTGSLDWKEEPENRNIYPIACVLAVLNSSINFIVYSVFNPKFRTVLAAIFWTKAHFHYESTEKGTLRLDLLRAN